MTQVFSAPVHILHNNHALCGLRGPPCDWQDGATWVSRDDENDATCKVCIAVHRQGVPSGYAIDQRVRDAFKQRLELMSPEQMLSEALDVTVAYANALSRYRAGMINRGELALVTAQMLVATGITRTLIPETDTAVLHVIATLEASNRVELAKRAAEVKP